MRTRGICSIHLDVDNVWLHERQYGLKAEHSRDAMYAQALPAFTDRLDSYNAKATFFVVGEDLKMRSCREFCVAAVAAGHEIANHTFSHYDLSRLSSVEKRSEIERAHAAIQDCVGVTPIGFRAPRYYVDDEIVETLLDLGYRYDSSILPGFATVMMRLFFLATTRRNQDSNFGRARDVFAPRRPQNLAQNRDRRGQLLEFPIAVAPRIRIPIHTTFAYQLGERYVHYALNDLSREPGPHVYLFHGIDFLDGVASPDLTQALLPLKRSLTARLSMLERILEKLVAAFEIRTTESLVRQPTC